MKNRSLMLTSALMSLALCVGSTASINAAAIRMDSVEKRVVNEASVSHSPKEGEPFITFYQETDKYYDEEAEADFSYEVNEEGQITLTGYSGNQEVLHIPEKIDEKPVTVIGESCFAGNIHLKKVYVPEGVVSLEDYAFEACSVLEKVYLPETLKNIGKAAFSGCAALKLLDIQEGVELIGEGAFLYCNHLVEFRAPKSLAELGAFAFAGCSQLMYADLSASQLKVIPDRTFYWCKQLSVIRTPYNLEKVGKLAFSHCEQMGRIWLPGSVREIGASAFEFCKSLTSMDISAETVEPFTFEACYQLEYVTLSEDVKLVKKYAFAVTNLTLDRVDIPEGVEVEEGAFDDPREEVTDHSRETSATEETKDHSEETSAPEDIVILPEEECTTPEAIIEAAREAGMMVMTNEDFPEWAEKYLDFNQDNAILTSEGNPYITMYKNEEPDYFVAMTAAASQDPEAVAQASERYGEDLVPMFSTVDHGLMTEVRRFRMEQDMLLYTGVYDSQLKAAAGTDHVPTLEELKACVGTTFIDPCLTSTTVDMEVSFHFSDTLFIIYAKAENINRLGAVCMDAYMYTPENEIFMNPGAQYRIKDVGTLAAAQVDEAGQENVIYKNYLLVELVN